MLPAELLGYLDQQEQDTGEEIERIDAEITELTAGRQAARERLDRLRLTRQTLLEITDPEPADRSADPTALPAAYQDILEVLAAAEHGLHVKDVCRALHLGEEPRHTENMRAKLKRLVGRGILTEPKPGLFTMNRRGP